MGLVAPQNSSFQKNDEELNTANCQRKCQESSFCKHWYWKRNTETCFFTKSKPASSLITNKSVSGLKFCALDPAKEMSIGNVIKTVVEHPNFINITVPANVKTYLPTIVEKFEAMSDYYLFLCLLHESQVFTKDVY